VKKRSLSVRIQDVAREAGVSVSTVSRVLNSRYGVADDTYQRVRKVIDDLGYSSSLAAKSMRGRTNVIGVVIFNLSLSFNTEIVRGIDQFVQANSYDLMVYTSNRANHRDDPAWERKVVAQLNGSIVDGIVVVTPTETNLPTNHPIVVIEPCELGEFPAVLSTNRAGTREAAEYLIELGHRRIGFIGGNPLLLSAHQRQQGYEDALAAAGIPLDPDLMMVGDYSRERGVDAARSLLTLDEPPTAIMAANDQAAFGVLDVAAELGIRVPQQLSVIGFDNTPESAFTSPPLTTVNQSLMDMGSLGAELLIRLIESKDGTNRNRKNRDGEGGDVENRLYELPTELIRRASCQPPAQG
jgi:LacI family transcriptional regulator